MARMIFEQEARQALIAGANTFARAVGSTLGPGGRNVGILSRGRVAITKDGVTVAREATLADPFPGVAGHMLRQASEVVAKFAGDGTTSVAVLTNAMLMGGHRLITAGYSAVPLTRAMLAIGAKISRQLHAAAASCTTREDVRRIALMASNGDEEVAHIVTDALFEAGPKGIVTIEDGVRTYCGLRVVPGAVYPTGWVSGHLVDDPAAMTATLASPFVLVTESFLNRMEPLFPILEKVYQSGRPVLIVSLGISGPALNTLVVNRRKGTLDGVAVNAPYFADIATEALRDICALTGATLHSPYTGRLLEDLTLHDLGEAHTAIVGQRTTTLVCKERKGATLQRVAQLEHQIAREPSPHEKERLRERLSKLAGGVAVIEVGAETEAAMKEKRDRIDDALHAARGAMEHGVLPGGGLALMKAARDAHHAHLSGDAVPEVDAVFRMMREACAAPLRTIARNAGANPDHIETLVVAKNCAKAYNARTGQMENPEKAGILDPAQVTIAAINKATEVAALILNTGCVLIRRDP